jgi:RNA recognition motif-containing protein
MKIYVGKLSLKVNEDDLKQAFEAYGKVEEVKVIKDKYTGESRGFAFIEMPTKAEALAAISGLNGKELKGDTIAVNEARPRPEGQDRGGRRPSY